MRERKPKEGNDEFYGHYKIQQWKEADKSRVG